MAEQETVSKSLLVKAFSITMSPCSDCQTWKAIKGFWLYIKKFLLIQINEWSGRITRLRMFSLSSLDNTGPVATKTYKLQNYKILITIRMYNKVVECDTVMAKKNSSGKWKRMKLDQRVGVFLEHRPRERAQIAKWDRAQMETVLQWLKQPICNNQLFSCPSLAENLVKQSKRNCLRHWSSNLP